MADNTPNSQAPAKAVKPTLFTNDDRFDPKNQNGVLDPGRIIGYSEIVQANDIAKADDLKFREIHGGKTKEDIYRLLGAKPRELDVEFAWLPVSGIAGGAMSQGASQQLDHYQSREGFQLANEADLSSRGFSLAPNQHIAADGTIRRESDVALYIRSGEVARKWERYKATKAAAAENALPANLQNSEFAELFYREAEERRTVEI
jgi:hypothetical protein